MSNKPIDLGALQDALRNAEIALKSSMRTHEGALAKYMSAMKVCDSVAKRVSENKEIVSRAKQSLVEGARAVANG